MTAQAGRTRVAVVGAGKVSQVHLDTLRALPDVDVVAVCDPLLERAQRAARDAGVPHAVADVAALPALDVQIAHVLVPPHLHVPVARELLEAGIGVLVEKPLSLSAAEGRALGALARSHGLPLGVNHTSLASPPFRRLLRRVRAGEVGQVRHVQVTWSVSLAELASGNVASWMFRSPRNLLFEVGSHPFAQLLELAGPVHSATTTVLATRELSPGQVVGERLLVAARAQRATAELFLAFDQVYPGRSIRVHGSDGMLEAHLDLDLVGGERPTAQHELFDRFAAGWRLGRELQWDSARGLARDLAPTVRGGGDPFATVMRASIGSFHDAVRSARPPHADAERGAQVVEWCEAAARNLPADEVRFPALPPTGPARPGEVLVLGGSGLIGLPTVNGLLARGLPVTVLVRRSSGLPPELVAAAASGSVRLLVGSLEDHASLAHSVEGVRVVLHLATGAFDTPEEVERSIVGGARALADACLAAGVERLVYISSLSALYLGRDSGHEAVDDDHDVDRQPQQRNAYVQGKIAAEQALLASHRSRGLPLVIARPGIVLGAGSPLQHAGLGEWVGASHCLGWGPGTRPLPVVLTEDIAAALVLLAQHQGGELDGKALNLAARVDISAAQLVAELRRVSGRPLKFRPRSYARMRAARLARWVVKTVVRRAVQPPPSLRDAMSMEHYPVIRSDRARDVLGWKPVEDREQFLDAAVRWRRP